MLISSSESTYWRNSSIPSRACFIRFGPSVLNGKVTMATVRISISLAALAITGAAPVPVPPPIPAVIKTILVPSRLNTSTISSKLSSAASRPRSGLFPAPSPSVNFSPKRTLIGTGLRYRAWRSVLQTMNDTSAMPRSYIWFTALLPPPPTPVTMMIDGVILGRSNSIISGILLFSCSGIYLFN